MEPETRWGRRGHYVSRSCLRRMTGWIVVMLLALLLWGHCDASPQAGTGEASVGGKSSATGIPDEELPWRNIKSQKCNVGMQSAYQKPMFKTNHVSATCGVYNKNLEVDFTGRPCCCSFCGQRDPNEQLCEIVKHVCSTVADCIQRHHGECVEDGGATGGIERFHVFWILAVGGFTMAPFIVPVFALRAAEDIVLGLAG